MTIIYLIYDMEAKLSASNVATINAVTELKFDDLDNVTYQNLIDARKQSQSMAFGYPKYKDGALIWVLPCPPMGLNVDPESVAIKEVSKADYVENYLPTFDVEDEEWE